MTTSNLSLVLHGLLLLAHLASLFVVISTVWLLFQNDSIGKELVSAAKVKEFVEWKNTLNFRQWLLTKKTSFMRMKIFRPQIEMALFVLLPTTIVGSVLYYQRLPDFKYEFKDVSVKKIDAWDYWFYPRDGQRFFASICHDYDPPQFASGMMLARVIFIDKGKCWSLNPNDHAGYFIRRNEDGKPEITEEAN